jgi:hypothetical protein
VRPNNTITVHGCFTGTLLPLMAAALVGFAEPPTTGGDDPGRTKPVPLMLDAFVVATATGGAPDAPWIVCMAAEAGTGIGGVGIGGAATGGAETGALATGPVGFGPGIAAPVAVDAAETLALTGP